MPTTSLNKILTATLEDYKAQSIQLIEAPPSLKGVLDYFLIGTATSSRHAKTLADQVTRAAKSAGTRPFGVEGLESGEWVLIDIGSIVVHIMLATQRELYQLEALWTETHSKLLAMPGRNVGVPQEILGEST